VQFVSILPVMPFTNFFPVSFRDRSARKLYCADMEPFRDALVDASSLPTLLAPPQQPPPCSSPNNENLCFICTYFPSLGCAPLSMCPSFPHYSFLALTDVTCSRYPSGCRHSSSLFRRWFLATRHLCRLHQPRCTGRFPAETFFAKHVNGLYRRPDLF